MSHQQQSYSYHYLTLTGEGDAHQLVKDYHLSRASAWNKEEIEQGRYQFQQMCIRLCEHQEENLSWSEAIERFLECPHQRKLFLVPPQFERTLHLVSHGERIYFNMLKKLAVSITVKSENAEVFEAGAARNGIFFDRKGASQARDVRHYSTRLHEVDFCETDHLARHDRNVEIIYAYLHEISSIAILSKYFIEPSYLLLVYQEISREATVTFPMKTISLLADLRLGISEDVQCE